MAFVHRVRPRYAEVDAQGVVFNAHWLTYFDEACTRWFEAMGFAPAEAFFRDFDVMLVKAVLEWQGPAGFDDAVDIAVTCPRIGTKSFDVRYTATWRVGLAASGRSPTFSVAGTHESTPIPAAIRASLEASAPGG